MEQTLSGGHGHEAIFNPIRIAWCGLALLAFWMTTAPAAAADPPEEIVIENAVYRTDRKGPVWFSHSEHADGYVESCEDCHHDYQDGKNIWQPGQAVKKCVACHDPATSRGRTKKLNIAYHKNCKGCHRELAKEGGSDAPFRQCTDCHAKR